MTNYKGLSYEHQTSTNYEEVSQGGQPGSQDDTQSQEKLRDKAVFKGTET